MKLADVGERLRDLLGKDWQEGSLKQIPAALERVRLEGGPERSFTAHELILFGRIFDLPPTWFLEPDHGREPREDVDHQKVSAILTVLAPLADELRDTLTRDEGE